MVSCLQEEKGIKGEIETLENLNEAPASMSSFLFWQNEMKWKISHEKGIS